VLELKGKLEKELAEVSTPVVVGNNDGDIISALMALGYSAAESRRVVASLGSVGQLSLEEKIRRALQQLAGGS